MGVTIVEQKIVATVVDDDVVVKVVGIQGPVGPGGNDAHYVHNQITPTTLWTINHNLGKLPSVSVVDSGENVVFGEVVYLDANALRVGFSAAFGGKAYLN